MKLLLIILVAVICAAQTAQSPNLIPLAAADRADFELVLSQFQILQKSLEIFRLNACLENSVPRDECGMLDTTRRGVVRIRPQPEGSAKP